MVSHSRFCALIIKQPLYTQYNNPNGKVQQRDGRDQARMWSAPDDEVSVGTDRWSEGGRWITGLQRPATDGSNFCLSGVWVVVVRCRFTRHINSSQFSSCPLKGYCLIVQLRDGCTWEGALRAGGGASSLRWIRGDFDVRKPGGTIHASGVLTVKTDI